jgi:hypothetical protein
LLSSIPTITSTNKIKVSRLGIVLNILNPTQAKKKYIGIILHGQGLSELHVDEQGEPETSYSARLFSGFVFCLLRGIDIR